MTAIDPNDVEALLHMNESNIVDFKRDPYPFVGASELQKSELVKDILCFANAWKTTDAHILIGVTENKGGRATVVGISASDHPDDASLQELVNKKTNRLVAFQYLAVGIDGKTIGIIRIAKEQERPLHLLKDFGKVKANAVWVKLNSGSAEAKPDEIAKMGASNARRDLEPSLKVEWAEPKTEQRLGMSITTVSRLLLSDPPPPKARYLINVMDEWNKPDPKKQADYERQIAKLYRVGLCVENLSGNAVNGVRVVLALERVKDLVLVDQLPPKPRPRTDGPYVHIPRPIVGPVTRVQAKADSWEIECRLGKVQPGEAAFSRPFYVACEACYDEIPVRARVYGDTMKPLAIGLTLRTIARVIQAPPPELEDEGFFFEEDT